MKTAIVILFILFAPSVAFPQTTKKIPVSVSHYGDDPVGRSVFFALKEAIRASQSFRYVDHDFKPPTPTIVVYMASLDLPSAGGASAISVSIVYASAHTSVVGAFINHIIQLCGQDKVDGCAKRFLVSVDEAVESLRKGWPDLWKTL